jgi:hypothetical protein
LSSDWSASLHFESRHHRNVFAIFFSVGRVSISALFLVGRAGVFAVFIDRGVDVYVLFNI